METKAKEEDPSSKLSVSTATAVTTPHPRQAQIRCNIDIESESRSKKLLSRHRCCSRFPCFGLRRRTTTRNRIRLVPTVSSSSSSSSSLWDKIQAAGNQHKWWAGPIKALMKLREWSEIVADRNWKMFMRRFNRNGCKCLNYYPNQGTCTNSNTVFQYDPLSYALNFDEGIHGRNNQFKEEDFGYYPDFTSRYVNVSVNSNSTHDNEKSAAVLDLGQNYSNTAPAG